MHIDEVYIIEVEESSYSPDVTVTATYNDSVWTLKKNAINRLESIANKYKHASANWSKEKDHLTLSFDRYETSTYKIKAYSLDIASD